MENLEQEPEEIPMDEVLAEIRKMLLKDTENKEDIEEKIVPQVDIKVEPKADYFLLTPEMRCDYPSENQAKTIQLHTKKLINKLQENKADEKLSPELEKWLNSHLPDMIEKILSKKLNT